MERADVFCVHSQFFTEDGEARHPDAGGRSAGVCVWCRQMDRCFQIRARLAPKILPEFAWFSVFIQDGAPCLC